MSWSGVADPTASQTLWQVMTSLLYGARGVMYFCYWNRKCMHACMHMCKA